LQPFSPHLFFYNPKIDRLKYFKKWNKDSQGNKNKPAREEWPGPARMLAALGRSGGGGEGNFIKIIALTRFDSPRTVSKGRFFLPAAGRAHKHPGTVDKNKRLALF